MLEVLDSAKHQEAKSTQTGKEEIKRSLLPDDMINYRENSKESEKKKILELISKFTKMRSTSKNQFLLFYTNNAQLENKITKALSFSIALNISKEKRKTYTPNITCTGFIC